MDLEDLEHRFKYHPPSSDDVANDHEFVRRSVLSMAQLIDEVCPDDCREKSIAITKLEEAMMWANAAIARNQPTDQ